MPEASSPPLPQAAVLVLDESVSLGGSVSRLSPESIDLQSLRVLDGKQTAGKVSLTAGARGVLTINDSGGKPLPALTVEISKAAGQVLTLTPAEDQALTIRSVIAALTPNDVDPSQSNSDEVKQSPALPSHPGDRPVLRGKTGRGADRATLEALRTQSTEGLGKLFLEFLDSLCDHLFDLSNLEGTSSGHNRHYEVMNGVKRGRDNIYKAFRQRIDDYFDNLVPDDKAQAAAETNNALDDLNLVDLGEFENDLALDRVIKTGENMYGAAMESLTIRLAEVIDEEARQVRLPVNVAQLSRALRSSLGGLEIPQDIMAELLDYYTANFLRRLGEYYEKQNALLRNRGINPGLDDQIARHGTVLNRTSPSVRDTRTAPDTENKTRTETEDALAEADRTANATLDAAESATTDGAGPSARAAGFTSTGAPASGTGFASTGTGFSPENLYNSVIAALNFRREAEMPGGELNTAAYATGMAAGIPDAGGMSAMQEPATGNALAQALSGLQQNKEARNFLQKGDSLRDYLLQNQQQLEGLQGSAGLSGESLNQIDLVDSMFGSIHNQLDVTQELRPTLHDLQIPLAKLALLEPQFFVDRRHSARGVIDSLAKLSSSANFPNKALENRIQKIVTGIVDNYDNDSEVFDKALGDVEHLVAQQERALARNVERVVKTEDGQQRLQKAQLAVNNVVRSRVRPPAAPTVLVELIESGWRDLLILTHLKEGVSSKPWKDHVKTLDLLSLWLIEQQKGDLDEDIRVQRQLEAEPFIEMIRQQISAALPTNVAHESVLDTLRSVLAGRTPIATTRISDTDGAPQPKPEEIRRKIETLPRLRRWVRRVEQLEKGTWLNYRDAEGIKHRMQLAWISEERDRYIFVNERGQKNADLTAVQLGRQLSRGVHPPAPAEQLSLVDQSLYTTLEHVQKALSFANNHDALTQLVNRETFGEQVDRALRHAQRKGSQHALLVLDIDQFALVNEVYDRVNGDLVLTEFARLLAQLHSKKISSSRLQDDEFGVLLLDRNLEQAASDADRIRSDISSSSVDIDGEKIIFNVSIGVAPVLEHSESADLVLDNANAAVRQAKELGRNRVELYQEGQEQLQAYREKQAAAIADIEQTLKTEHFLLQAQPIVKTAMKEGGDSSSHYEILLGLRSSDGGIDSPQEFILAAERYGYMVQVDQWVVREAFRWISNLMDNQKEVPNLSINISGSSVTNDSFMEYLFEQISDWGVGTSKLCFEITETGTINNLVKAADFVRAFRNIGCRFSIDDFGTGLASHNYLRELPVDYVKIDGSVITNVHNNRNDYAMAKSINDLAHFLEQETIAESVENDDIANTLKEIGVDYVQGWGVGKPRPLEDVTHELSAVET